MGTSTPEACKQLAVIGHGMVEIQAVLKAEHRYSSGSTLYFHSCLDLTNFMVIVVCQRCISLPMPCASKLQNLIGVSAAPDTDVSSLDCRTALLQGACTQGKTNSSLFSAAVHNRLTAGNVSMQSHLRKFALHTGVQRASTNALQLC